MHVMYGKVVRVEFLYKVQISSPAKYLVEQIYELH
jgi:hypothetical protein